MKRPPALFRILFRVVEFGLLLGLLWAALDLHFVMDGAETDHAAPADVLIVLGCHAFQDGQDSDCIKARAAHAADLYRQGLAPNVITSGGRTQTQESEASVLARIMESEGVPADKIIQEDQSLNTIQNIRNSKAIMQTHGWTTVLLVTEPNHINRAALIARDKGLTVYPSPAVDSPSWHNNVRRFFNIATDTLSTMYYQVKRLTGTDDS